MKIILSVDAIKPPLTGIGRYVWELAKRIPQMPNVASVKLFSGGRWVSDVDRLLDRSSLGATTRRRLLKSPLAVATYNTIAPIFYRHRLRGSSDYIFHGPNFYLPPFDGIAIATVHDLSIFRFPQCHPPERVAFMKKHIPIALKRATHIIADSEYVRNEVVDYFGWHSDRIFVVPLGVSEEYRSRASTETAPVLNSFGLTHDGYTLCVATVEPRKNLDALITAYESLPRELRSRYPLVLVGGRGWQSEDTHRRIAKSVADGWLRYLGFVDESALPIVYSGARGFIFPSLYEGFGLPVLEAMASGLPVAVSNRSALPETAAGAADIFEADDVHDIKRSLRKMLEDTVWRDDARARSVAVASQRGWADTVTRTLGVYRQVLNLSTPNRCQGLGTPTTYAAGGNLGDSGMSQK